jgi:hypothetical protein
MYRRIEDSNISMNESLSESVKSFRKRKPTFMSQISGQNYWSEYSISTPSGPVTLSPDLHKVLRTYDEILEEKKTLIHIWWEFKLVEIAKTIIERISSNAGQINDVLDDYLKREHLIDSPSKVKVLEEYVNRKDQYGIAPIHTSSNHGDIKMIKLLWANEWNPYERTNDGLTVIHSAAEGDTVNVILYFSKKYEIDIDTPDYK